MVQIILQLLYLHLCPNNHENTLTSIPNNLTCNILCFHPLIQFHILKTHNLLNPKIQFLQFLHMLPWQINSTLIIFSYLHLSLVFLLKRLIFQGFPTFEFSFLFKVSSQIFSYFLIFFPAILVNPLVKQASLPTGFFNYSLSDILLPLRHQNSHGCKCSRLR